MPPNTATRASPPRQAVMAGPSVILGRGRRAEWANVVGSPLRADYGELVPVGCWSRWSEAIETDTRRRNRYSPEFGFLLLRRCFRCWHNQDERVAGPKQLLHPADVEVGVRPGSTTGPSSPLPVAGAGAGGGDRAGRIRARRRMWEQRFLRPRGSALDARERIDARKAARRTAGGRAASRRRHAHLRAPPPNPRRGARGCGARARRESDRTLRR
jgi:hypothetical protein